MKTSKTISLLFLFCLTYHLNHAQIALNGTVDIIPYQGLQEDLINGVSEQLASENPVFRHVCLVDKNILAITIDEQAIIYKDLEPYEEENGDTILMKGYHGYSRVLEREGEQIGYLCGVNQDWYRPFNTIVGSKLDINWASNPENFIINSGDDKNYFKLVNPIKVFRKSYPNRRTHIDQKNRLAKCHEIYLVLPFDLETGKKYSLQFEKQGPFKSVISFDFEEVILRSEAIHANLVGYRSNEPKVAFMSTWMGDGGNLKYKNSFEFNILNTTTNQFIYSGKSQLKGDGDEYSYNLTDVHILDFSELNSAGNYRIVVKGIGCSFDFEIRDDIWEQFARLNMKGFFHQRSGIEMGPPYTAYQRPRNMHPADEVTIHKCDVDKFFNQEINGQQGVFKRIQSSILTNTEVPEAWGGWMDAGDFDQRMSHLHSVHRMMYLYEMNPEYFENLNLGIPESENNIPDILDEALWCLNLYKRTQGVYEKGGISWWIESVEHPRGGEGSWLNSLPTAIVPPTPGACLTYASCAAQMSLALKKYNVDFANEYLQSALDAMAWIENNPGAPDIFYDNSPEIVKAMAYVNLYRATADQIWHQKFVESLKDVFPKGIVSEVSERNAEILLNYLLIGNIQKDNEVFEDCKSALVKLADELLEGARGNIYDIFKTKNKNIRRLVLPSKSVVPIASAHFITKDKKYSDALCKTIQYTMGANPMNRSYVSGLGERWFIPYQLDFEVANSPAPSGIPNYGPTTQTETNWGWTGNWAIEMVEEQGLYPEKLTDWPYAEKCFNNTWIAPINEFTVGHPMGELIMLTGYLAQIQKKD